MLRANQIARITSDFKMDLIKGEIRKGPWIYTTKETQT